MNLKLMICCNDYRNGLFRGYIEHVSLDVLHGDIELNGPRVRVSFIAKTEIRIGRVRSVMLGYRDEWVGNWCWDCVLLSSHSTRLVLNYLKSRGWSCDCAPTELYDRWREEGEIEPDEWDNLIEG